MHVLLSDALTCPRCGPEYGLVLLADKVENRRVLEGWLGCPNCRERFGIHEGFGDLRWGQPEAREAALEEASSESALRLAAMLGITDGPALIFIAGAGAAQSAAVAALVPHMEVVAAHSGLAGAAEQESVSRLAVSGRLPFRDRSMKGAALTDTASLELLEEAVRVIGVRARLVVRSGAEAVAARMEAAGLGVLARDAEFTVAERVRI